MFRHFSLAIFRLINKKLYKQLHSTCLYCIQWGGKRCGGYEIWHVLCRVGGVGSGTFCCRLVRDLACVVGGGLWYLWYFLLQVNQWQYLMITCTYTFQLINYIQYATVCECSVYSLLVTIYSMVLMAIVVTLI